VRPDRAELPRRASRPARPTSASSRPVLRPGKIGVVSKSGTLTYQIGNELKQAGEGNSSIVGIGGDPISRLGLHRHPHALRGRPETELIVMVGEIGGDAEERAAEFIAAEISKPVVAYIAGFTAPPGKQMGHAGAIISGSSGTAQAKKEALEAKGVRVGESPTETARDRRRSPARLAPPPGTDPARPSRR
jgi:succinyl-CoA synthetase alpha subunit